MNEAVRAVLRDYPRIYFACHARHRRDPKSRAVLSERQASILDHLDLAEPLSLGDLAAHMGVTLATMSIAVERLVRDGYIARSRSESDGRRLELTLTAAGARMKRAQSVLEPGRVQALLDRLSADEREQALRGLALLARAASASMGGAP